MVADGGGASERSPIVCRWAEVCGGAGRGASEACGGAVLLKLNDAAEVWPRRKVEWGSAAAVRVRGAVGLGLGFKRVDEVAGGGGRAAVQEGDRVGAGGIGVAEGEGERVRVEGCLVGLGDAIGPGGGRERVNYFECSKGDGQVSGGGRLSCSVRLLVV